MRSEMSNGSGIQNVISHSLLNIQQDGSFHIFFTFFFLFYFNLYKYIRIMINKIILHQQ